MYIHLYLYLQLRRFSVCNHVMRRPRWWSSIIGAIQYVYNCRQYNRIFFSKNYHENGVKFSKGERCFSSWPPTWPPWCHVQTRNRFCYDILKQIKDVYNCRKLGVVLILVNEVQHRRMPVRTFQWRGENLSPPIEDYTWIKLNCNIKPR